MTKVITIVQRRLTHYRVPFFTRLISELASHNIKLKLVHGRPAPSELTKNDEGALDWAEQINTWYGFREKLCWLDMDRAVSGSDLVILTPENKMLSNLPQQYFSLEKRVALWGHGANLQGNVSSLRERFKRIVARQTDWWFGYTDLSVPLIRASGFPLDRITVLNNAVDTRALAEQFSQVTEEAKYSLLISLGLKGHHVGVYVGSLYGEKRVPFMLQAAEAIQRQLPEFEFLIIGSGPDKHLVEAFCLRNPWVRYLGVQKGQDKVNALALGKVMINPGLVGLGILDSFVCQIPMVTTDCGLHSPEIAYLEDGRNGRMTPNSLEAYVDAVAGLLKDGDALALLKDGCASSAVAYTVENMARNFADGVMQCLEAPMYRGRGGS